MAQQRPQLAHRGGRDPRLRKQIGAQQLRQRPGVDSIVFQPGRGDRLASGRMRQVRFQLPFVDQL
jgi:hypothetical protein